MASPHAVFEIVDADTTITQQTIRDCLTQQLYALELVPPPDGVTIKREIHLRSRERLHAPSVS